MAKFLMAMGCVIGATLLAGYLLIDPLPSFFYETMALLAVGTLGLYYYLVKIHRARPDFFIPFFVITLVLKMLAYAVYIFVVFKFDEQGAARNAVYFAILYFIFTGLEVLFVYRQITR